MRDDRVHARSFCVHTLGCKVNQAESEAMLRSLVEAGLTPSGPSSAAVIVLNTCTVTSVADHKSRQWLRQVRRSNPESFIVATGCYAERSPADLDLLQCVDLVVPNSAKPGIPGVVLDRLGHAPAHPRQGRFSPAARARSVLKVQDGCQSRCAYCIVPSVRPDQWSLPPDDAVAEARARADSGFREIVVTGTKLGSYQHNGTTLPALLMRLLTGTDLSRIRVSSLQPQETHEGLLALWNDPRLCRHFHLALQSGSDRTLAAMRRQYTAADFREALDRIRNRAPEAAITTDVLVGFPGETSADFADTEAFCREAGFAGMHVFPYSPRPGTEAARLGGVPPEAMKRERVLRMLALARESRRAFQRHFVGCTLPVLWEAETSPGSGVYTGLTDNYLRVRALSAEDVSNRLLPARLTAARDDALEAEIV